MRLSRRTACRFITRVTNGADCMRLRIPSDRNLWSTITMLNGVLIGVAAYFAWRLIGVLF